MAFSVFGQKREKKKEKKRRKKEKTKKNKKKKPCRPTPQCSALTATLLIPRFKEHYFEIEKAVWTGNDAGRAGRDEKHLLKDRRSAQSKVCQRNRCVHVIRRKLPHFDTFDEILQESVPIHSSATTSTATLSIASTQVFICPKHRLSCQEAEQLLFLKRNLPLLLKQKAVQFTIVYSSYFKIRAALQNRALDLRLRVVYSSRLVLVYCFRFAQ